MGLDKFFRVAKPAPQRASDDYWDDVRNLCAQHVCRTVDFFTEQNAPRIDWARPRFEILVGDEQLDLLMKTAQNIMAERPDEGLIAPELVCSVDGWHIFVLVYPSGADADFLRVCPEKSFEKLALESRKMFRLMAEDWERLDVANWILLLDPTNHGASVHLHTIWSLAQTIQWLQPRTPGSPPALISAPSIIPMDLLKQDVMEFSKDMHSSDANWYSKNDSKPTKGLK